MPELPEVEYTARQLRASVLGARISDAQVFWERTVSQPTVPKFLAEIAQRQILNVRRRGKYLLLDLSGELFLSIHRRMTGNLLLLPSGWQIDISRRESDPALWNLKGPVFTDVGAQFIAPSPLDAAGDHVGAQFIAPSLPDAPSSPNDNEPDVHRGRNELRPSIEPGENDDNETRGRNELRPSIEPGETEYCRVCFNLADGRRLLYTDPRKFGRIALWPQEREEEVFQGLGPEPLSEGFTVGQLQQALVGRKGVIKQVLLAQEVVAGLGNIYADEALYYASIHPLRRADSLTEAEIALLHEGIVVVLNRGIQHGGTSFSGYRDLQGEAGNNYEHLHVYHKANSVKICERCGTPIERLVIVQRTAHFCPQCQPLASEA